VGLGTELDHGLLLFGQHGDWDGVSLDLSLVEKLGLGCSIVLLRLVEHQLGSEVIFLGCWSLQQLLLVARSLVLVTDGNPGAISVSRRYLREKGLERLNCAGLRVDFCRSVCFCEDPMWSAEANVGSKDVSELGLKDADPGGQSCDEAGSEFTLLNANQQLHFLTTNLCREGGVRRETCSSFISNGVHLHQGKLACYLGDSLALNAVAFRILARSEH
jgi:hypothetical protein